MNRKPIYAISILSGTIIGVGLFSLPYITSKVGIWVVLGYFLVLGPIAVIIHLFFAEIALKTPDFLRLPGFAKIHLGEWGKRVALVSTISGFFGSILAYLIVGGGFLGSLLGPVLGGSFFIYTLFYFAAGAALIYFGIKTIAKVEFWGLVLFFVTLIAIFFRAQSLSFLKIENLFQASEPANLFLPYGAVLFSLWGMAVIPEIEEMLGKNKELLRKVIPIAILIPIIINLFFIFLVLGITGVNTTESAIVGLRNILGDGVVTLALLFGLAATFTSFITLGLTLKKVFWYDLKIKKNLAWAITCFIPLILFLIGFQNFIEVISIVGGVMLGISAILILLMYKKVFPRKNRFLILPLILIFLGGIICEIIYFIK